MWLCAYSFSHFVRPVPISSISSIYFVQRVVFRLVWRVRRGWRARAAGRGGANLHSNGNEINTTAEAAAAFLCFIWLPWRVHTVLS